MWFVYVRHGLDAQPSAAHVAAQQMKVTHECGAQLAQQQYPLICNTMDGFKLYMLSVVLQVYLAELADWFGLTMAYTEQRR